MKITEFKKGDNITRVSPSKITHPSVHPITGEIIGYNGDMSYIGDKFEFIGIANGCLYLKRDNPKSYEKEVVDLNLISFSDGWDYFIEIDQIGSDCKNERLKSNLKEELQSALSSENYELIKELKDIFDNIVKS